MSRELVHFHAVLGETGRGQGPGSSDGISEPMDVYDGPEWTPTSVEEMTPDQKADACYEMRLFDSAGQDSAYAQGLSERLLPAPKGGWPIDADPVELSV